jgi:hypothetical protein
MHRGGSVDPGFEERVRLIVKSQVRGYSAAFEDRHMGELDDPEGTINAKVHNIFIAALGPEIQFFSAMVRSLDSSMGSLIEKMALQIAEEHFDVQRHVEGVLYSGQTALVAALLEGYKARRQRPQVEDYQALRSVREGEAFSARHDSDYALRNKLTGEWSLVELKIGGDLDNKKARSEKEALLEQFSILCNREGPDAKVRIYFGTAYNRYGEGKEWRQERVRQFFAPDELLISTDFWNFITQSPRGYEVVIDEYRQSAHHLKEALLRVKSAYVS